MTIIYQDKDVLVIDKPAGVAVQTTHRRSLSTKLVNYLSDRVKNVPDGLWLVHRLDKDTSGVIILAKNLPAQKMLQSEFKARTAGKLYLALVEGVPKYPQANIDLPIGRHPKNPLKRAVRANGKPAQTAYKTMRIYLSKEAPWKHSLLEVTPSTGRTHQIRVHLAKLGHPVVGDALYGHVNKNLSRHWLHASKLRLRLPNGEAKTFSSPLPLELVQHLKRYNRQ